MKIQSRNLLVFLTLAVLTGCTTIAETSVHRGNKGVHINCSGLGSSWERCYSAAAVACGGDSYRIIARSNQHGEDAETGIFGVNPAGLTTRTLLIKCAE